MPSIERHHQLLRRLDDEYQRLSNAHYKAAPRGGVPVGGGDWMDTFFRMEAIRGTMSAMRAGKNLRLAMEDGKAVSAISVGIWNAKREWQVHRWEKTAWDYLESLISRLSKE